MKAPNRPSSQACTDAVPTLPPFPSFLPKTWRWQRATWTRGNPNHDREVAHHLHTWKQDKCGLQGPFVNEDSRDASSLRSVLCTLHNCLQKGIQLMLVLSYSSCVNAPKLGSKKGYTKPFIIKTWRGKALFFLLNQIGDENERVIFTKTPNFRQTLSINQPCVLLELHEPILSQVGWVFAVCKIPVTL